MQITLKTLQQQTFKVEVEETDTVLQLKEKIEASKGDQYPVGGQKLITAGKVMEDGKTLKDYKITEKGFIVVMVTKAKPTSTPKEEDKSDSASAVPVPAAAAAPAAPAASSSETPASAPETSPTPASAPEPAPTTGADPPAVVASESSAENVSSDPAVARDPSDPGIGLFRPEEYQNAVTEMMAMGFDRTQVESAMRASFNHPDRAVEFLLSGNIPTGPAGVAETPAAPAANPVTASGGQGGQDFVSQLQAWPQFQQMRQVVQTNPNMLPELLQQLGRANPELLSSIQANQERFLAFLNAAPPGGSAGGSEESGEDSGGQENVLPGAGAGGVEGGYIPQQIRVTQQEREAIDRLKALGFPEHLVIQAYFACDKNEDAAANFLLNEGVFDDEEFGA